MAQPGLSDDGTYQPASGVQSVEDRIKEQAAAVADRAETVATEISDAVRQRPYTTLAIAAGLAFAVGAIWKLGSRRPPSRLDALRAHLPDMPRREALDALLPRNWR